MIGFWFLVISFQFSVFSFQRKIRDSLPLPLYGTTLRTSGNRTDVHSSLPPTVTSVPNNLLSCVFGDGTTARYGEINFVRKKTGLHSYPQLITVVHFLPSSPRGVLVFCKCYLELFKITLDCKRPDFRFHRGQVSLHKVVLEPAMGVRVVRTSGNHRFGRRKDAKVFRLRRTGRRSSI